MNNPKKKVPRIRGLLRGGFTEFQKDALEKIFTHLYNGETLNVKEIRGLNDLTKMKYQEFINFTGFNKTHLTELVREYPPIINSDGSYSPTNLLKYLRSAEYRKKSVQKEEIKNISRHNSTSSEPESNTETLDDRKRKTKLEADMLEEKLNKLKEKMIPKEDVEMALNNRAKKLLTYLSSTLDNDLWRLENKSRLELKILKDEIVKKAIDEYLENFSETGALQHTLENKKESGGNVTD